jgi:DNA-binding XRE family transcriptional regulator
MRESNKYWPLYIYLQNCEQDALRLTFVEIERLLGQRLPDSARNQRAWWSNRSRGAVQARAWMEAGYRAEALDLAAEAVTFRKPGLVYTIRRSGSIILWNADLIKALRYHMGLNQAEFARELGVRQPTISEWETGQYEPKRSTSKLLTLVAEQAGFYTLRRPDS